MTISLGFNVYFNAFTSDSSKSHFSGTREELAIQVQDNWHKRTPGNTVGSVIVPVSTEGQYTPVVKLKNNQTVFGTMGARQYIPGDEPAVSSHHVERGKSPALFSSVIVYSREALIGDHKSSVDRWEKSDKKKPAPLLSDTVSTIEDWEIVMLKNSLTEDEPQHPVSLARNILGLAGGSPTRATLEELARSVFYWATHAMAAHQ